MKMQNLQDLLLDQVRDLYDAEKQLVKALPKMAEAASSPQLKRAFEDHWQQTKGHVTRLEEVFKHLSHSPKAKSCKAMEDWSRRARVDRRQGGARGSRCWADRRRAEGGTLRDCRIRLPRRLGRSTLLGRGRGG